MTVASCFSETSGRDAQDLAGADQTACSATLTDVGRQARAGDGTAARRRNREAVGRRRRAGGRLAARAGTGREFDAGAERIVRVPAWTQTTVRNGDAGEGGATTARSDTDLTARTPARRGPTRSSCSPSGAAVSRSACRSDASARARRAATTASAPGAGEAARSNRAGPAIRQTRDPGTAADVTRAGAGLTAGTPDLVRRAAAGAAPTALSAHRPSATAAPASAGYPACATTVRSTAAVGAGLGRRSTRSNRQQE